jgi:hypothetical protein
MSKIRMLALAVALAAGMTAVQPRPAEAGGGGLIAGLAIGITAAAIWHHHHGYNHYGYNRGYDGWYPGKYVAGAVRSHHGYRCHHARCGYYR